MFAQLPPDAPWREVLSPDVTEPLMLTHDSERVLALALLQLPDVIANSVEHLTPHLLCDHVHTVAQRFHSFYTACPVIDDPNSRTRLALCAATDATLRQCMQLLGVNVVDRL